MSPRFWPSKDYRVEKEKIVVSVYIKLKLWLWNILVSTCDRLSFVLLTEAEANLRIVLQRFSVGENKNISPEKLTNLWKTIMGWKGRCSCTSLQSFAVNFLHRSRHLLKWVLSPFAKSNNSFEFLVVAQIQFFMSGLVFVVVHRSWWFRRWLFRNRRLGSCRWGSPDSFHLQVSVESELVTPESGLAFLLSGTIQRNWVPSSSGINREVKIANIHIEGEFLVPLG